LYDTVGAKERGGVEGEDTYPVFGIDASGTAAVFKITEDLESIDRAASIGIHPVDTCSMSEKITWLHDYNSRLIEGIDLIARDLPLFLSGYCSLRSQHDRVGYC
jgi:hypothetical protein